jgi:hypothetical protein
VPIVGLQQKTFGWLIQYKIIFVLAIIIVNPATPFQTNGSLHSCFVPMTATNGLIYAIDIKYPFYIKWNCFFYDRQVTPLIGKSFQI